MPRASSGARSQAIDRELGRPDLPHHARVVAHAPVLDDASFVGEAHQVHLLNLDASPVPGNPNVSPV